jgi:5-methylcytosine-specific restriction enzyme A
VADFPRNRRMSYQHVPKPHEGRKHTNPFYQSKEWRKIRNQYIKDHPLCEECLREDRTTPGKEVDHIKPVNQSNAYDTNGGYYGEPLDYNNLQTLCTMHHAKKSGRERHS